MPTNATVRDARSFLFRHGIGPSVISPRRFAAASHELGKSFAKVLELIMALQSGGQGVGQAPIATRIAEKEG